MTIWQIATGEPRRDYSSLFWAHDVMILGPSDRGDALQNPYADGVPNSPRNQVDAFAKGPKPGDRVLMRLGKKIIGVGAIPPVAEGGYCFDTRFSAVLGWDLRHTRRVCWAEGADLAPFEGVYDHAKQKPSFTRVHEANIIAAAQAADAQLFARPLKPLPEIDASRYSADALGTALFRAGLSNNNIASLVGALQQAERLCSWYWSGSAGRAPSEHEVVSHILLPVFLGLGWSHQQIAVEWNRVDMAFFKRTPTSESSCVMVLEAKGLGQPLSQVLAQPQSYVNGLSLKSVRKIVVTDGANLFVFDRAADGWAEAPSGYVCIPSLQREYLLPRHSGLVDTLVSLQPSEF